MALKRTLLLIFVLISGCSSPAVIQKPSVAVPHPDGHGGRTERPSALQVLKDAGLMDHDDYSSADYIPNSNHTMIYADVRNAPCKMIFRYITTSNGNYWMPNQIGCSP
ncbi:MULTISPECIES: hypothetical protein [Enterobacteriaceae]|uniref:hypothetical protein n=1 Tax=Enterobacteriaceae TaxID=543 RepID=UPI000DE3C637|nr:MULTISPECIES: hypothetical protein [Enterobacteriaceae]HCL5785801.1 hypothetical protein [Citrobacter freundii]